MAEKVTNATLAALMTQRFDQMDERVDGLTVQVKETNGRLRHAETAIAILEDARKGAGGTGPDGVVAIPKKYIALGVAAGAGVVEILRALWPMLTQK